MKEIMYCDTYEGDVINAETAQERIYDSMEWDDLEKSFSYLLRVGRFGIADFFNHLPEWIREEIDEDSFNKLWDERFVLAEEEEDKENA